MALCKFGVRVELPCDLCTNYLPQSALVRSMYVLIHAGPDLELVTPPFLEDLFQTIFNRCEFGLCEDSGSDIGSRKCDGPSDVLGVEGAVEVYRLVVSFHQWISRTCMGQLIEESA
jgi:hypothetical protein